MQLGDDSILALPSEVKLSAGQLKAFLDALESINSYRDEVLHLREENAALKERITNLAGRVAGLECAQDELDAKVRGARTPGSKQVARLAKLEQLLLSRHNSPMTFSEIGKALELGSRANGKNTRRQNMTLLGKSLAPDRFEVFSSKTQNGKMVRLTRDYYQHLVRVNQGV